VNTTKPTMKTEDQVWTELRRHASAQLRPGFADRVLRAARAGAEAAPSLLGIFSLSAATAIICLAVVSLYRSANQNPVERDDIVAGWEKIAADSDEFAAK